MMYTNEELNTIVERTKTIMTLTNEIYEVEDDYLETWLEEGLPDGSTITEIVEFAEDENTYKEWVELAKKLLEARKNDEGVEDIF